MFLLGAAIVMIQIRHPKTYQCHYIH